MDIPLPTRAQSKADSRSSLRKVLFAFPWWLAAILLVAAYVFILIASNPLYSDIFIQLREGIGMTLRVSFTAYLSALVIGLIVGVIRAYPPQPGYGIIGSLLGVGRVILFNVATLYVQILRGLPILVTLLIVAFVIVPGLNTLLQDTLGLDVRIRGSSAESAILALAVTYGAFLSETFRAGIQSIARGQIEAARSLGMSYVQVMRFVVLPQAVRRILPPLGNDMIAMVKDSSLVAILGIQDITQLAKLSSSSSFRYLETYLIAAVIYLVMTILGSLLVRFLERRFPIAA